MKKTTKRILLAGLLTAVVAGGCKKSWLDINTNPNKPVDAQIDPSTLEGGAVLVTATNVVTGYQFLAHWFGFLATSAGVSPNTEEQSYNITTTFNNTYGTIMDNNFDFQLMQSKADATGMTFYSGIAKIMKSLNYARLVDLYNNIPYTEVYNAPSKLTPKYDDAKTIYEDLIKQIDAGIAQIKTADLNANPRIATVDKLFAGNKLKWQQFGNTLKLRLLIHQAGRADRQSYITTEIAKIVAEGSGFLPSGGSAYVNPGYSQSQPNPYYSTYDYNTTGGEPSQERANNILVNLLKTNNDPRLNGIYQPIASAVPAGNAEFTPTLNPFPNSSTTSTTPAVTTTYGPNQTTFRGYVYGASIDNSVYKNQTRAFLSKIGSPVGAAAAGSGSVGLIKGWDAPLWIITSVESLFLQAEAIQRGYLAGDPATAYQAAVKESFLFLNITNTETVSTAPVPPATQPTVVSTTLNASQSYDRWYASQATNANVNYATATDKLKLLATQKYIALSGVDQLEIWNDYRRFGAAAYPFVTLSVYPTRSSQILPVRLLYVSNEVLYNSDNVPSDGRKTGDQFTSKIWWMP